MRPQVSASCRQKGRRLSTCKRAVPGGRTVAGAAESEPPGAADAQKAPGGDEQLAGRATQAGAFRTWVGKTLAECGSLERMHLDLEQEMEDEERN